MDVQAFKNIRNYLFASITEDIQKHKSEANDSTEHIKAVDDSHASLAKADLTKNKLHLYLFHLFESVVNNVAQLV